MSLRLKDKVALVTGAGAGSGIGAATARRMAEEGALVVVTDINSTVAQKVVQCSGLLQRAAELNGGDSLRWRYGVLAIRAIRTALASRSATPRSLTFARAEFQHVL